MAPARLARRCHAPVAVLTTATLAAAMTVFATGTWLAAGATEQIALPAGSVTVHLRGNGHGHGMSQYGARGAAIAGLSASAIVAFYYPGTSLVTLGASTVRVLVSGTGSTTTVAAASGLSVTGVSGTLPTSGISRYRLAASGGGVGLTLQRLVGSTWSSVRTGLADGAEFSSSSGHVRVFRADGSSTAYRGATRALRGGGGVLTINRVSLDGYTAGVVPREMPSSWQAAAVRAQAIAARSYGRNAVETHTGQTYDICDTTQCQVYGGMTRYDSSGAVLWTEDLDALTGNANTVLQYNHATIFAQFSASNGGWTVDGGQPYLIARSDPYDNAASGDPYLSYTSSVSVAGIASHYGLATATALEITARDGHGTWGGRVTAGYVDGKDAQGTSRRIATTGFGLQAAMGVGTTWIWVQPDLWPTGNLEGFGPTAPRVMRLSGWTFDPDHTDRAGVFIVSLDGVKQAARTTTLTRTDVQQVFHTVTSTLGFSVAVKTSAGSHTACLYGQDQDGLGARLIMCRTAVMPDPLGSVDSVTKAALHTVRLTGWSFDPDHNANRGRIQVYLDKQAQTATTTTLARPDVQQAFHTAGDLFGYNVAVSVAGGDHGVCVYGVDQDGQGGVPLRCTTVSIPQNPLGHVDALQHVTAGYQISGWTFDPDQNGGSTKIEVFIGGALAATIAATAVRADVQRAYGLANNVVGFSALVPASSTKHTIMIKSINTGPGVDSILVNGWA